MIPTRLFWLWGDYMSTFVLRMDYCTFNFDADSLTRYDMSEKLAGDIDLCWHALGTAETAFSQSPFGLFYRPRTGCVERPHCLQVSGVGCSHFMQTLPTLRAAAGNHISRIDFAFDAIMSRSDWRAFISTAFSRSLESDRKLKRYVLSGSGEAMTVYVGSRNSPYFFRIYNKTLQDPEYIFVDANGDEQDLADDQCVIRYEIEYHRFRRTQRGEKILYDPSWMFDAYYSEDPTELIENIRKLWLSYGEEFLLPPDFEHADFLTLPKLLFCWVGCGASSSDAVKVVGQQLHDAPHSFSSSLYYVVDRFGQYLPYILANETYFKQCMEKAGIRFGWETDIELVFGSKPVFYDIEADVPLEWNDWSEHSEKEQLELEELENGL